MNNIDLEKLLQDYFGLKGNLFLKNPDYSDMDFVETVTKRGAKAYCKMTSFIYDLVKLGVNGIDEGVLIDELDSIVREKL